MKTLLSLLLFLLANTSFSQKITATATRQEWAGGVCCVTGTNYVITIKGSVDSLNNSEFHEAYIDGYEFSINKQKDKDNTYTILHYNFSHSIDKRREIYDEEIIEIKKESFTQDNYIVITYNGERLKIPIEPITDLMYLAYP